MRFGFCDFFPHPRFVLKIRIPFPVIPLQHAQSAVSDGAFRRERRRFRSIMILRLSFTSFLMPECPLTHFCIFFFMKTLCIAHFRRCLVPFLFTLGCIYFCRGIMGLLSFYFSGYKTGLHVRIFGIAGRCSHSFCIRRSELGIGIDFGIFFWGGKGILILFGDNPGNRDALASCFLSLV